MNFKVLIDSERCKGCEYCVEACLHSVLKMSKSLNSRGNHFPENEQAEACTGCKRCVSMCPDMAIRIRLVKSKGSTIPPPKEKQ
jgi:2-oxoglutarate ferredoxin oxidoreductase subunit delta